MKIRAITVVGLLVVGISVGAYSVLGIPRGELEALAGAQTGSSIQGAWRVTEVIPSGTGAAPIKNPAGLYIFTKRHYSVTLVRGDRTEPADAADPAKLTDAEKIARYEVWQPFTANAGTYEVSGGMLMTKPVVAKSPGVMAGTAPRSTIQVTIEGNTLTLIQKAAKGPAETRITLTRVE